MERLIPPVIVEVNRGVGGVSKVLFVERMEGEVLYGLTFPTDTLGGTSLRHPRKVRGMIKGPLRSNLQPYRQ